MGLDQYAFINPREEQRTDSDGNTFTAKVAEKDFYWRKHSRLQTFMEKLWVDKTGKDAGELNCEDMELDAVDLTELFKAVKNGYADYHCDGGFFYGHQHLDESAKEYRQDDLDFIEQAAIALQNGQKVIYHCWW